MYIQTSVQKTQGNCKPKIYNGHTYKKKKKESKHNIKDSHQITREENKRRKQEKRPTKTNPKQLTKWQ